MKMGRSCLLHLACARQLLLTLGSPSACFLSTCSLLLKNGCSATFVMVIPRVLQEEGWGFCCTPLSVPAFMLLSLADAFTLNIRYTEF